MNSVTCLTCSVKPLLRQCNFEGKPYARRSQGSLGQGLCGKARGSTQLASGYAVRFARTDGTCRPYSGDKDHRCRWGKQRVYFFGLSRSLAPRANSSLMQLWNSEADHSDQPLRTTRTSVSGHCGVCLKRFLPRFPSLTSNDTYQSFDAYLGIH